MVTTWWGDYNFEVGQTTRWDVGQLKLAVQRYPREWMVAHEYVEAEDERYDFAVEEVNQDLNDTDSAALARFVFRSTPEQLTVLPALADRSVVTRPITPFTVLAGESGTVFVSTLLWLTLSAGRPPTKWFEIAVQRPPDTWFGPSTMVGETCYASRTYGRLNLEKLVPLPHRAFTQVHIRNDSLLPLLVERVNLPVPFLSLFQTAGGWLWTETVLMRQPKGSSLAEMTIEKGPPAAQAGANLIAGPRLSANKGMLVRAFEGLGLTGMG